MRQQPSLFVEDDQIKPVDSYAEPHAWIRRLVIVDRLGPGLKVLRRVRFRCGINIITTEPRGPEDRRPVGHSVGKSLLIRLIRYCLGDSTYCTEGQRRKITAKLESAYVLGNFRVAGEDWVVARPLGLEFGLRHAYCARSPHLRDLLFTDGRQSYGEFVTAINAATATCYADLDLPQAGRRAEWKDLLGWLCRDQDCHFRHHADWRDVEAESGPRVLSRDDAYLVMRMAMDLLSPEETGLIAEHRLRLKRQADAQREVTTLEPQVRYAETQWRRFLPQIEQSPFSKSVPDALEEVAKAKQNSLQGLLDDQQARCRKVVEEWQQKANELAKQVGAMEQELSRRRVDKDAQEALLKSLQSDEADQARAALAATGFECSFFDTKVEAFQAGCPGRSIVQLPVTSPERTTCIDAHRAKVRVAEDRIGECVGRLSDLDGQLTNANSELRKAQDELQKLPAKLLVEIGQWRDRQELAEDLRNSRATLQRRQDDLPKLALQVKDSQDRLAACRDRLGRRLAELSRYYTIILRHTITPDADGTISLDGNGLHPDPGSAVADSGTTLREYADVLSFDLACLAAAICGMGHVPRLWMHDSPRQADSEEQLFHAVLRLLNELEATYPPSRAPSFQYILSTTSPPPDEVNRPPFVRLRLDARKDSGLLLGIDSEHPMNLIGMVNDIQGADMWVNLDVQLGIHGSLRPLGRLWLDSADVHSEAHLLGAYHILSMGQHYDHYVVAPFLPTLPSVTGFNTIPHPYVMVTGKVRAAGVTGNIGEAVAAIFARRVLGLAISDIAHIRPVRPFSKRKAPDFALRAGTSVSTALSSVWPSGITASPNWWAMESKARATPASADQGVREALGQLAGYWYSIRTAQPNDVGFGLVATLLYRSPKRVIVSLFVPRSQASLHTLIDKTTYRQFSTNFASDPSLRGQLYGC